MSFPDNPMRKVTSVADAGVQVPSGAQASVFPRAKRPLAPRLDPEAIQIRKHVPLPPVAGTLNRYGAILARMEIGDMAEFENRKQASGFVAHASKAGRKVASRCLPSGKHGVWLLA